MFIKQSTSVIIAFGPFVDKTDGVTLETGLISALDHATTGIWLSKNGGAFAVRNGTPTATTYTASSYGHYLVTLNTTDTNTLGHLRVTFAETATCLPVYRDLVVLHASIYDALIGATEFLPVDAYKPVFSVTGSTLTVKKVDGTTTAYTKALTTDAAADPVVGAT